MHNPTLHPSAYIVNNAGAAGTSGASTASWGGGSSSGSSAGSSSAWVNADASCESTAYALTLSIACCEGATVNTQCGLIIGGATRQWILGTYSECLQTVHGGSSAASYPQTSSFRQAS